MASELSLIWDLIAKDNASSTFKKVGDSADTASKHTSNFGTSIAKFFGGAALAGAAAAIAGVGLVIKTGFGEAMDASKGTAQLAAGIKSTGNAAGVSVKGLNDLASSIQGYSGQTDDSIVKSEQMLLTFTNIKNNGVDKIFDQATVASANMAAKFGGDASSNAIVLGKALNDPVKGITALTRVGVSFTQGQKDSIAAMVKTGDTAGAQKVILGELSKEFGGAAKAAGESLPGQMAKAKRSFEDISQAVVTGLMPAFSTALSGINSFIQGVTASFNKGGLSQVFTDLGAKISAALPGIKAKLAEWGKALWEWVKDAVPPMLVKLGELLTSLGTWVATVALPAIAAKLVEWGKAFVEWIVPMIPPVLAKLGELLVQLGTWLLTVALPAIGTKLLEWGKAFVAWIGPMIPPVLVALGGLLLKLGGWLLTTALPAIVGKLAEWALAFAKWVPGAAVSLIAALGELLVKLGGWILTTALPAIVSKLLEWAGAFIKWVAKAVTDLPAELGKLLSKLTTWAGDVPGKIKTALGNLGTLLKDAGSSLISGFWDGIKAKFEEVKTFVGGIATWIKDHKGPLDVDRQLLIPHGGAIMDGFNEGLTTGFGKVQGNVGSMAGRLSIGSLDFASSAVRSNAISGTSRGATSADIAELGAIIRALPKDYQMGQRQGAR